MTNTKNDKTPIPNGRTGYKKVDAVIYVVEFVFNSARKDFRAFVVTILVLMMVVGWACFIWQVMQKDKAVKEVVEKCTQDLKHSEEMNEQEKVILRNENAEVKREYINISDEFKAYQKSNIVKTEALLERLIKQKK